MEDETTCAAPELQWKLWIYTNYDCNLRCSYCVAKSSPNAPRRAIGLANARRLVDEAVALGFTDVFFTGGEPFILNEIYEMLAYASARIKTTVLTNAMISARAAPGKAGRDRQRQSDRAGQPRWRTGRASRCLSWGRRMGQDSRRDHAAPGARLSRAALDTPRRLRTRRISKQSAHFIARSASPTRIIHPPAGQARAIPKRGWSWTWRNLMPELTVNLDGVFWHPLSTDADMQVSKKMFPLASPV